MSIITLILSLSFLVNSSLSFPTEHQLTTYGANNASSTSQLTTTTSNTWSTPEVQSNVNCTCSINTTKSWITYPGIIPTDSICNSKTEKNCTQACAAMLQHPIFNVQSQSVGLNNTDGVVLDDYLCGLMAKDILALPYIVLTSEMSCKWSKSSSSDIRSIYISLPMYHHCRLIEKSDVNATLEIIEMTSADFK